jgi:hypothetical protein
MRPKRRGIVAAVVVASALLAGPVTSATAADCPNANAVKVPGAEMQKSACLDDLTTAGTSTTGHTDQSDWESLHARDTKNPTGVPGLQVDGYFPDTSTFNTENGWNHDAQFVIRFPNKWNGKLVITGAPGIRKQYSTDFVIGDWVLAAGYAYASTDKGNSGNSFYQDGDEPGDAIAEWHFRVTQLATAVKKSVRQRYGRDPSRTYMTGISNGGYLTRWQLENRPDLYDGGADWEGTLITSAAPNLFTYLPAALRNYPKYRATGDSAAHDAMIAAGFEPGSEFLWDDHYAVYWDLTQRSYREEFDPEYDGPLGAGIPFCQPGTPSCDADYRYASRPQSVKNAMAKVSLHGTIRRPLLTLHGTWDALLPIRTDSDLYNAMIGRAGKASLHRYYVVEHGNHVDGRYDLFPDKVRPILPCYRSAFGALTKWVERGSAPPPDQFVPDPHRGDIVNTCALATTRSAPAAGGSTPAVGHRLKPRLRLRVSPRRDRRAPYRFRISGRVVLPRGVTRKQACGSGTVSLKARSDGRTVARKGMRLNSKCAFGSRIRILRRRLDDDKRLVFVARFSGNRALVAAAARATARVG